LGKRRNKFGIEIAQTAEDNITAGLQEVHAYLISGLFILMLTLAGCVPLFGKLGLDDAGTTFLEQVSLFASSIFLVISVIALFAGSKSLIRRLSIQPALVTGRVRSWRTPSLLITLAAAIVWAGGFIFVVTTSYFDLPKAGTPLRRYAS